MQLQLVRHLWGVNEPWELVFPRIKAAGYTAIEAPLPAQADIERFRQLLELHQFGYVALVQTVGRTMADHWASFRDQVAQSEQLPTILITSHCGHDSWDTQMSHAFLREALALETTLAVPIGHETHRGRILHHPWITSRFLDQFPGLRLCSDLSHWVVACERLLDTETEILAQCAERTIHIHARVGYEEGPQVPDPRAPEYQRHLDTHEAWWDQIWQYQAMRGDKVSTFTPEYGPPLYAHLLPYSAMPVANIWEICDWQAHRAARRFYEQYPRAGE
jgi:sugar phosphate isomerase/epimerase